MGVSLCQQWLHSRFAQSEHHRNGIELHFFHRQQCRLFLSCHPSRHSQTSDAVGLPRSHLDRYVLLDDSVVVLEYVALSPFPPRAVPLRADLSALRPIPLCLFSFVARLPRKAHLFGHYAIDGLLPLCAALSVDFLHSLSDQSVSVCRRTALRRRIAVLAVADGLRGRNVLFHELGLYGLDVHGHSLSKTHSLRAQ